LEVLDNSGNLLSRYAQSPDIDEPLAELIAGTTNYYEADSLGSNSSLSNSSGVLANTYTYDSYGRVTASTGTIFNPFQYKSEPKYKCAANVSSMAVFALGLTSRTTAVLTTEAVPTRS
jgi:hypothetical protein